MSRWKNRRTGRVVDLPDERPSGDRAEEARWVRTLAAMDASKRWERLDDGQDPDPDDPPSDVPDESWSRDRLREEAQRRGLAVGGTKGELLDRLRS